jgi:hypothetical protein
LKETVLVPETGQAASQYLTSNWVEEIRRLWAQGATSTLALARIVCQARMTLAYGEWTRLWSQPGLMPFSKRKAEMLVAISEGMGLIDAQTLAHLPRGWSILYYLSKLGQAVVEQLVGLGTIHPALTLQEARALVARHQGQEPPDPPRKLRQKLRQFERFVAATLSEWTAEDRRWTQSRLNSLANKIAIGSPAGANAGPPNLPASLDPLNFAAFTLLPGNACAHPRVALRPECPVPFDFHQSRDCFCPNNSTHL